MFYKLEERWEELPRRWLDTPEMWSECCPDALSTMYEECLVLYGVTCDETILPKLVKFYRKCINTISTAERLQIYNRLSKYSRDGERFKPNGVIPVLLLDPDRVLVFNAAFDVLRFSKHGDEALPAAVYQLIDLIQRRIPKNCGAIFACLVLFLDRSMHEPLLRLRDSLSYEECAEAANCLRSSRLDHVMQFCLAWCEFMVAHPLNHDKQRFDLIMGCMLARPGLLYWGETVCDVHYRKQSGNGYTPYEEIRSWSGPAYARTLLERLRNIERDEPKPRVTPWILKSWQLPTVTNASDCDRRFVVDMS